MRKCDLCRYANEKGMCRVHHHDYGKAITYGEQSPSNCDEAVRAYRQYLADQSRRSSSTTRNININKRKY